VAGPGIDLFQPGLAGKRKQPSYRTPAGYDGHAGGCDDRRTRLPELIGFHGDDLVPTLKPDSGSMRFTTPRQ